MEVVNSNTIVSALKAGKYDLALRIPTDLYKTYSNLDNLELLGRQELYYSYMGFKVGHFDKAKGENIMDPNAKMADKNLRQALAYGLDVDQMTKAFYYGLRERATMSVPPAFKKYYSKDIKGYPYDPEIDVYFAAWGVGTNLNPFESAGRKAAFNYTRFVSEENDKLMAETSSPKTLEDPNYKAEAYKKWQEYYIDQAVEVPLTFRYEIFPVNKRVKNYYIGRDSDLKGKGIQQWELTAAEPIKATN